MVINKWLVFAGALLFWVAFFYWMDGYIMEIQGLPVGSDLMPV